MRTKFVKVLLPVLSTSLICFLLIVFWFYCEKQEDNDFVRIDTITHKTGAKYDTIHYSIEASNGKRVVVFDLSGRWPPSIEGDVETHLSFKGQSGFGPIKSACNRNNISDSWVFLKIGKKYTLRTDVITPLWKVEQDDGTITIMGVLLQSHPTVPIPRRPCPCPKDVRLPENAGRNAETATKINEK